MAAQTPEALASVLGARQDRSAKALTTRGLLITVLGEFMLPHGGQAWTQTIVAAMETLGVQDKSARQALARMEDRGWLTRDRVGRQTVWSLTSQATDLLRDGAARIYGFNRVARVWDGRWAVLVASVPAGDRNARYRMAQGLNWAGFGSIGQGVWVCPWVDQEQAAADLLSSLGVEATSFIAQVGQLGTAGDLAADAWDLPQLRTQYDQFLADTDGLDRTSHEGTQPHAVAELAGLVHRWRRFPFLDPGLPAEVLPADWPGPVAAQRFTDVRASLHTSAARWWSDQQQRLTPAGWGN